MSGALRTAHSVNISVFSAQARMAEVIIIAKLQKTPIGESIAIKKIQKLESCVTLLSTRKQIDEIRHVMQNKIRKDIVCHNSFFLFLNFLCLTEKRITLIKNEIVPTIVAGSDI